MDRVSLIFPVVAGKPIPTELRADANQLKHLIDLDDDQIEGFISHHQKHHERVMRNSPTQCIRWAFILRLDLNAERDDEYRLAGSVEPKIMVTTSREPSSRLKQFAKVCSHTICCLLLHLIQGLW